MSALLRKQLPTGASLEYTGGSEEWLAASQPASEGDTAPILPPSGSAPTHNGKTLVLLDANEVLLNRKFDPEKREYVLEITRPFAANAIRTFIAIPDVNLGLWTGVQTAAQETAILSFLAKAGIAKSTFVIVLQALNCCGRKGKGSFFPGTTKRVYVKPVALVETLLPGYKPYLLVDNDLQKSEGLGPIDNRRLANTFLQHLEVHPFRGLPGDKCLDPSGGCCWLALQKRLAQLHDAP